MMKSYPQQLSSKGRQMIWPEGKRFAFSIFDDPDCATVESTRAVYDFLAGEGFRTTIGVWPNGFNPGYTEYAGVSCADMDYRDYVVHLQDIGFEPGYHCATIHTSTREQVRESLEKFKTYFGTSPKTMSNHFDSRESLYWGSDRLSGWRRMAYNTLTLGRHKNGSLGHKSGTNHFWGDLAKTNIKYCRNFVFSEINTLKLCPFMPYHDPDRDYVNYWYSSSEAADLQACLRTIPEAAQDKLVEEGGACILYTHLGKGFYENGKLDSRFQELMTRLSKLGGWYVPVGTLLDHLLAQQGNPVISNQQRSALEARWLMHKVRFGSA
jgi:hypothetical protein